MHKASTAISQNHAMASVDDLKIKSMSKSSIGNADVVGKHVAQKSGLKRSILGQGLGEFRRQLAYKMVYSGGSLITVPPQYTSQTCLCCGDITADNWLTQAQFLSKSA